MFKRKNTDGDDRLKKIQDDIEAIKKSHQQIIDLLKQKDSRDYVPVNYPSPRVPDPISIPTSPNEFTNFKKQCKQCGLTFNGVTGYVCNYAHCPTFLTTYSKITSNGIQLLNE